MRLRIVALGLVLLAAAGCAQLPSMVPPVAGSEDPASVPEVVPSPTGSGDPASRAGAAEAPPQPAPAVAPAPPPPADIWQRLRGGFQMSNLQGPLVQEWEQWYSTRPDYVARMVERSSRFLYHVIEEVERRGMPAEVALLPMIESAYNPQAYSRSHASGMWQFIPSTGRNYGLRQNFWYDGRRDPIAATSAALDYLEKLYGMFGNWELALAAYNWGEGAVSRAIAKNQAKGLAADYESLTMPPETRNYVPKLQAVKNIVANPQAFGLSLAAIPNRPYFATVTTDRHIDVKLAARLAEMPLEEFRFLNPAHNKPVIKASGTETILLPRDKAEIFRRNLSAHDKPLVSWQAYTVKRSDKPEKLAASHGMSLAELKTVNGLNGARNIAAGQTLMVPLKGDAEPHLPDLPAQAVPVRNAGKTRQAGKSTQIARARAVSAKGPRQAAGKKPPARATRVQAKRPKGATPPVRKVAMAESGNSASK